MIGGVDAVCLRAQQGQGRIALGMAVLRSRLAGGRCSHETCASLNRSRTRSSSTKNSMCRKRRSLEAIPINDRRLRHGQKTTRDVVAICIALQLSLRAYGGTSSCSTTLRLRVWHLAATLYSGQMACNVWVEVQLRITLCTCATAGLSLPSLGIAASACI